MADSIINSMEKIVQRFPFQLGCCAGAATVLLYMLGRKWNPNLSVVINLCDLYLSLKPNKLNLGDSNTKELNEVRRSHAALPMGPLIPVASVKRVEIPSTYNGPAIPVHIFTPNSCPPNSPIVVFIHGGGFVVGNTKMYEPIITYIANKTRTIVVGVDYRKAPEDKFPCGVQDCLDAVRWVYTQAHTLGGDSSRLAVMGDSAGGNLTAIVSLELSDLVYMAIPIYPVIYFGVLSESKVRNADAPVLKATSVDWYNLRYFRYRSDLVHPLANPLERSKEQLAKAPYTHVITAEFDVLLDEGVEYVQALRDVGVKVTYKNYRNTVHGFFGNQLLTHGQAAMDDVCDILKRELRTD